MTAPDRDDAHAAGVLARHLTGRLAAHVDPGIVATALVALMRDHGWRPIPRPPQIAGDARGDPPNTAWRTARQKLTRPEGDQP